MMIYVEVSPKFVLEMILIEESKFQAYKLVTKNNAQNLIRIQDIEVRFHKWYGYEAHKQMSNQAVRGIEL